MGIADTIVFFVEIVGTVAFALSGAVMAVQRRMDIFGVLVLGVCTAVGGGVIRDILLGITPPNTFRNPVYALVAALASALIFFVGKSEPEIIISNRIQNLSLFNFLDALGLGIFTVVGINTAINAGFEDNAFLQIFVGVTTGVGGGILRDMLGWGYADCTAKAGLCVGSLCRGCTVCVLLPVYQSLGRHVFGRRRCGYYTDARRQVSVESAGSDS